MGAVKLKDKKRQTTQAKLIQQVVISVIITIVLIIISNGLMAMFTNDTALIILLIGAKIIAITAMLMVIFKKMNTINGLQKELESYEEKYKFVINSTTDGLWEWDILNNTVMLPDKWKEKLGYQEYEIPNTVHAWENLIHPEDFGWVTETLNQYLRKEILEFNVEYRMIKKNGEIVWIHDKGQGVWDTNNNPIRIMGTHADITFRKEAEEVMMNMMEENKRLLDKALVHERLQSEFFSNISHEFKTPLNVILGSIQLLDYIRANEEEINPQKLQKSIKIMRQNCYRLLRLINNLLDTTKLDYNAFNIKYGNYNIIHIIEEITQSTVILAQNKGVSIIFDTDVEEIIMACDINIIERIMLNLLSNAIKYTEAGDSIYVKVFYQEDHILISVKDTGIGIAKEKLEKIFDRFMQVDGSLNRKVEGTGIGLSLVKNFIDELKGEVWVESQVGVGSEFFVKLPAVVLAEEEGEVDCGNYVKDLTEQINVEFSDIY